MIDIFKFCGRLLFNPPLLGKYIQVFKEKIEQLKEDILEEHKQDVLKIIENLLGKRSNAIYRLFTLKLVLISLKSPSIFPIWRKYARTF